MAAEEPPGTALAVGVVGVGPRGMSVLERVCANAKDVAPGVPVEVHLVDPYPPGPGRVWRTAQSPLLLMNTVAAQITLFTDDSVDMDGPVRAGPSLYEWARRTAGTLDLPAAARAELAGLGPDTYPTRALYGHYLEWLFAHVVAQAPEHVTVRAHAGRAVALDDDPAGTGRQVLTLADGTRLRLHAVVLAQGHLDAGLPPAEADLAARAAAAGLRYVEPANPADVDLSAVPAGEPVLVRGLGLCFFDYLTLLTTGRGGRFDTAGGELAYRPSGAEPLIVAGSRRGVPYHARGENEKGPYGRHTPRLLTVERVAELRRRARREGGLDFTRDLWPLVAREVEIVYYAALLRSRGRPEAAEDLARGLAGTPGDDPAALLAAHGVEPAAAWRWDLVARPYLGRTFADRAGYRRWLLDHLRADVAHALGGNVSGPVKAALDVLRDLRNEVRLVVDHGGLSGESYRDQLDGWFTPLNAYLSIGPPVRRVREMIALLEAGVLDVPGPELGVAVDGGSFVARSLLVPGPPVRARVLVEARLPAPDVRRCTDPLVRHLLGTGRGAPYRMAAASGPPYETGGLAVGERPYPLLDAAGRAHPRRFAFGVPTEAVHWVTAAGARPGVNSVTFADSDAIARAVLAVPPTP